VGDSDADPSHLRRVAEWVASTARIHARLRALPVEERRAYLCPPVVAKKKLEAEQKPRKQGQEERLGFQE
jgi:hypothetical protein